MDLDKFTEPKGIWEEGYRIEDIGAADWAARQIKRADAEYAEALAQVEAQQKVWQAYLDEVKAITDSTKAKMTQLLEEYAREQFAVTGKKTLKMPNGSAGFTKRQPKRIYKEEDLLAYLEANGSEYIKVTKKPRWAEYSKTLTNTDDGKVVDENGQVLDFMTWEAQEDSFNVKVK